MINLQDIVEAAERPNLASKAGSYDRFGFFIDTGAGSSLEEKAEFLRKQAENHHDELDEGALQVKAKVPWEKYVFLVNLAQPLYPQSGRKSIKKVLLRAKRAMFTFKLVKKSAVYLHFEKSCQLFVYIS